jgi:hypothetical protein
MGAIVTGRPQAPGCVGEISFIGREGGRGTQEGAQRSGAQSWLSENDGPF